MTKLKQCAGAFLLLLVAAWLCAATPARAYTVAQVSQLVAPVALYPDALLSNVLAASTYPDEVMRADQWVRLHGALKPALVNSTLASVNWDPSIKSLTAFPDVLAYLAANMAWTEALGNAFLTQPNDVEGAIQTLRLAADHNGALQSNAQVDVTYSSGALVIEATDPGYLYVPEYDYDTVYYQDWTPIVWGPGIDCGQYLWLGCFDWRYDNMYFGQGYNYYYRGNYPTSNPYYQGIYQDVSSHRGAWQFNPAHRLGRPVPTVYQQSQGRGFATPRSGGYSAGPRVRTPRTTGRPATVAVRPRVPPRTLVRRQSHGSATNSSLRGRPSVTAAHPRFAVPHSAAPSVHNIPGLYNVRPGAEVNIERSQGAESRRVHQPAPLRPVAAARMSRPARQRSVPLPQAYRPRAPREQPAPRPPQQAPRMQQQAPRQQQQAPHQGGRQR